MSDIDFDDLVFGMKQGEETIGTTASKDDDDDFGLHFLDPQEDDSEEDLDEFRDDEEALNEAMME